MNTNTKLKISILLCITILVSMLAFAGVYKRNLRKMENIIPKINLGIDLVGGREIVFAVQDTSDDDSESRNESEGEQTEDGEEAPTDEEVPENEETPSESKTSEDTDKKVEVSKEDLERAAEIMRKRLDSKKLPQYKVSADYGNNTITLIVPNDDFVNDYLESITEKGTVRMVEIVKPLEEEAEGETEEPADNEEGAEEETIPEEEIVLMTNDDIKNCTISIGQDETYVYVYFNMHFNKEGQKKFKEIIKNYTEKEVTLKLNDQKVLATTFDANQPVDRLSLSIGQPTDDVDSRYLKAVQYTATFGNGELPLSFDMDTNETVNGIMPNQETMIKILIGCIALFVIVTIGLCMKYKTMGLVSGLSIITMVSILVLLIRYIGIVITISGIVGSVLSLILFIVSLIFIGNSIKKEIKEGAQFKKTISSGFANGLKKLLIYTIPLYVVAITCSFLFKLSFRSFGETLFWGLVAGIVVLLIMTRTILFSISEFINSSKKFIGKE